LAGGYHLAPNFCTKKDAYFQVVSFRANVLIYATRGEGGSATEFRDSLENPRLCDYGPARAVGRCGRQVALLVRGELWGVAHLQAYRLGALPAFAGAGAD
jgi:hypothetical protein